jgi:hypothetical protein
MIPVLLLAMGCSPKSLNLQRSALRAAGDLAATEYLDLRDEKDVPSVKEDILEITGKLDRFSHDGSIKDLTKGKIAEELSELIPEDYRDFTDLILDFIDVDVETDKIGKNNLKRIRAALFGIIAGTNEYDVEDRPVEEDKPVAEPEAPAEPTENENAERILEEELMRIIEYGDKEFLLSKEIIAGMGNW